MPDGVSITAGSGTEIATDQLPDGKHAQLIKLLDGAADGTARIGGDATNGLDVDVTRLPALPAGANAIGSVSVSNLPATQPVSASALPLPSGAATETSLASALAGVGAVADAEATGNGSLVALLKRLRTLLGGTLAVSGTFWQATQPVSGTVTASGPVTDAQLRATAVPVSGTVTANAGTGTYATKEARAATAPTSNVSASASSVTVLAANADRLGATVWNDSAAILYLKFGAGASATSCTVKLVADAFYEVPYGYTGILAGLWASATGAARVTELVA